VERGVEEMVVISIKVENTKLISLTYHIVDLERCDDRHRNRSPMEFADYYYDFWGLIRLNADYVLEWYPSILIQVPNILVQRPNVATDEHAVRCDLALRNVAALSASELAHTR
jgi:hypothetical protein